MKKTIRGFAVLEFKDDLGFACSLQETSLDPLDRIWLGIDGNRMYLTRRMVKRLMPHLQTFLKKGHL